MMRQSDAGTCGRCRRAPAGILLLAGFAAASFAQEQPANYPTRPVRMVIGTTPGGALDGLTRLAAQKFGERFGHNAIVDNRPGAGTMLAMDIVAAAQPDGHTLLCASETLLLLGATRRTRYDVRKAFTPVAWLTTNAYVLVVNPSVPATNVKELIAYARTKPGAVSYGTPGVGTTLHVIWERFSRLADVLTLHVPYKGGALATLDVISGQIQATITTVGNAQGQVKAGRLRGLATTGLKRMPAMPELPTIAETALPGFEAVSSYSLYAPAGVAPAIIRGINTVMARAMQAPEAQKSVKAEGAEIAPAHTPDELRAKFEREFVEMEKVVRGAKIAL
jgi:tripartite-type tricarboxylate transporter receptor subunit TctC